MLSVIHFNFILSGIQHLYKQPEILFLLFHY